MLKFLTIILLCGPFIAEISTSNGIYTAFKDQFTFINVLNIYRRSRNYISSANSRAITSTCLEFQ